MTENISETAENTAETVSKTDCNPRRNVNFLNTEEAAKYLKCSVMAVRRAVKEGRLACRRFSPSRNSRLCFEIADLDAFVQATKEWHGHICRNSAVQETLPEAEQHEKDKKSMIALHIMKLDDYYNNNRYLWQNETAKRAYIYSTLFLETNAKTANTVDFYFKGYGLNDKAEKKQIFFDNLEDLILFHRCHIRTLNEIEAMEAAKKAGK